MDEEAIKSLFYRYLLREPTADELSDYLEASNTQSREQVADRLSATDEAQNINGVVLPVIGLYQAFIDRLPEPAGLAFWTNAIINGEATFAQLIESFVQAEEFSTVHPEIGFPVAPQQLVDPWMVKACLAATA